MHGQAIVLDGVACSKFLELSSATLGNAETQLSTGTQASLAAGEEGYFRTVIKGLRWPRITTL